MTTTSVSAFPNPANSYITLKVLAAKAGTGVARITDGTGKIIATKKATLVNGLNLIKFDKLQGLKSGNYFVQLTFNYHVYNEQVVLIK